MIKVDGQKNDKIYSGKQMEGIYLPEGGTIQKMPNGGKKVATAAKTAAQSIADGKAIYSRTCFACHQNEGQGILRCFHL